MHWLRVKIHSKTLVECSDYAVLPGLMQRNESESKVASDHLSLAWNLTRCDPVRTRQTNNHARVGKGTVLVLLEGLDSEAGLCGIFPVSGARANRTRLRGLF